MDFRPEFRGFWNKTRIKSFLAGIILLIVSLYIQSIAGRYTAKSAGHFVGDFFLDNLPVFNLDFIIVKLALVLIVLTVIFLFLKPKYLIFTAKAVSVFIIVRSFFVSLTHLGIYPNQIILGSGLTDRIYDFFNLQDGYFFSGHTGMPVLMALIFWDNKFWRKFFIFLSIIFGISVLLAHVHYSIDVFAAPFITYGIFRVSERLFKEDYKYIGMDFKSKLVLNDL